MAMTSASAGDRIAHADGWDITAAVFVLASGAIPRLKTALSHPALVAIGAASYSIYLVHDPLIYALEAHGVPPGMAAASGIAFGFVFYSAVERWFVRSRVRDYLLAILEPKLHSALACVGFAPALEIAAWTQVSPPSALVEADQHA
jgi:peptidoglycan/LPS O-acetylase OafA/YrhL